MAGLIETEKFERVEVTSVTMLRTWLEAHHSQTDGVWLVTFKKHAPDRYVSVGEILDALLCFGWIDGIRRRLDADRTMQLISPRRVHHWAASYKERATRLIAEKRMQPAGLAAIAESKRRGLWEAMRDVDALAIPPELAAAFDRQPGTAEAFAAMAPSYRRNVLRWIKLARTPSTRAKRVAAVAAAAARNEKLPQM